MQNSFKRGSVSAMVTEINRTREIARLALEVVKMVERAVQKEENSELGKRLKTELVFPKTVLDMIEARAQGKDTAGDTDANAMSVLGPDAARVAGANVLVTVVPPASGHGANVSITKAQSFTPSSGGLRPPTVDCISSRSLKTSARLNRPKAVCSVP